LEPRTLLSGASGLGLTAEFFDTDHQLVTTRTDPTINYDWGLGAPDPAVGVDSFSARWTGKIVPEYNETYTFYAKAGVEEDPQTEADEGIRLSVDDLVLIDTWDSPTADWQSGEIDLTAGQQHDLSIDYKEDTGKAGVFVKWSSPSSLKQILPTKQLVPAESTMPEGVLREWWTNVGGDRISDLIDHPSYHANRPDGAEDLESLDDLPVSGLGDGDWYGQRIRGYLSVPETGKYTFTIAGDENAQLWLSNDAQPENKCLITSTGNATDHSQSDPPSHCPEIPEQVFLDESQRYYIEVLHVGQAGADDVSVTWVLPDETKQNIPGSALTPIRPEIRLQANRSITYEGDSGPEASASFTFTRQDDFGRDLDVYYTVGGTSTDGVDYALLPGSIVIPRGQASATIEIAAVEDNNHEGTELAIIRVTPSDEYSLGPEACRQVVATIVDGAPPSGINLLPNNSPRYPESDPSLAEYDTYGDILHVRVHEADAAETQIRVYVWWNTQQAVSQGDTVVATLWFRTVGGQGISTVDEPVDARVYFADQYSPSQQRRLRSLGMGIQGCDQWTRHVFTFRSPEDYAVGAPKYSLLINLGFKQGTYEIGGVTLHNFKNNLPPDLSRYGGRDANAAWRETTADEIEANRKSELEVHVSDPSGNPVEGATVRVRQRRHDYGSGSAIREGIVTPELYESQEDNDFHELRSEQQVRYRAIFKRLFNKAVPASEFRWGHWQWEKFRKPAAGTLNWLNSRGIAAVGHPLLWSMWWDERDLRLWWTDIGRQLRPEYEAMLPVVGEEVANQWLLDRLLEHVLAETTAEVDLGAAHGGTIDVAGLIPGSQAPRVSEWYVVNHPAASRQWWSRLGDDAIAQAYIEARGAVDPGAKLVINEGNILSLPAWTPADPSADPPWNSPWTPIEDRYFRLLEYVLDASKNGIDAPLIDEIGMMGHFRSGNLRDIQEVKSTIERFAQFGKPLQITEFDVDRLFVDAQTQADYTRDVMQLFFGHPDTTSIDLWGFWEDTHWRQEEDAHLFNSDWTVNPNGQVWLDLVHDQWWTDTSGITWADGVYKTPAFYGEYEITVTYNGWTTTVVRELVPDETTSVPITVPITVPGVIARHVFYNNSAFDCSNPNANSHDDAAVAADKEALLPRKKASFRNYTSYDKGINGVMVDIVDLPDNYRQSGADFVLRVGNGDYPDSGTWHEAPVPLGVHMRRGAGTNGSDRVTITWEDNVIENQWLRVEVRANANTGLPQADVFYFGNTVGESGDSMTDARVNAVDILMVRNNPRTLTDPAPIDFPCDFNRDRRVNATDMLIARGSQTHLLDALKLITPAEGKVAPLQLDWLWAWETNRMQPSPDGPSSSEETVDALLQMWPLA